VVELRVGTHHRDIHFHEPVNGVPVDIRGLTSHTTSDDGVNGRVVTSMCSLSIGGCTQGELSSMWEMTIEIEIELKLLTTCAGKLDRLMSLGPLYFAIRDVLARWARVSSTGYTYRHTLFHCASTFLGS
jgi:hypothetical protein